MLLLLSPPLLLMPLLKLLKVDVAEAQPQPHLLPLIWCSCHYLATCSLLQQREQDLLCCLKQHKTCCVCGFEGSTCSSTVSAQL